MLKNEFIVLHNSSILSSLLCAAGRLSLIDKRTLYGHGIGRYYTSKSSRSNTAMIPDNICHELLRNEIR